MRKVNFTTTITTILLILSVVLCSVMSRKTFENTYVTTSATADETTSEEMRGLWISYITLDMSGTNRTYDEFKVKFDKILSTAKDFGCNTLIVQVRPFCDALYKSEIFPASHILSGVQGEDAGYDALEYMCERTHSEGMKFHAWINPYRVATSQSPEYLAKNNPFIQDNTLGVELSSGIYLNPAKKAVRKLIADGVAEIVRNYDVDGIQFDDYFYPADFDSADDEEYTTYQKSVNNITKAMYKKEWRENNVNLMLAQVYHTIKEIDDTVMFGISPQGNIDNNYNMGADVKSWCENIGYADYICPQMYYSLDNPALSFEVSLQDWKEFSIHKDLKVYIGIGAYKAGTDADEGTWLNKDNILATQVYLLRRYDYDGFMIYDYSAFESETAKDEIKNLKSIL